MEHKLRSVFSGTGFYVLLAVSLLIAAAAVFIALILRVLKIVFSIAVDLIAENDYTI